jgi:hypothetical protein
MSALRRLRPRVRSGVGPKSTKARCRIRRKIKRTSVTGSSVRVRGACELGRRTRLMASTHDDATPMILRRYLIPSRRGQGLLVIKHRAETRMSNQLSGK